MTQPIREAFVPRLKRDLAATVGAKYERLVDRNASRLLPFKSSEDAFASRIVDEVQQELHDTFVDTTWPHCPAHPNHPLWFVDGAWRCTGGAAFAAPLGELEDGLFRDALAGLRKGDFTRLTPLFFARGDAPPRIVDWHQRGMFDGHAQELDEALSCGCFVGALDVVDHLLDAGLDATCGTMTGLDGVHWAANRGQLAVVKRLIDRHAPLETINMHGTTVLGTAVWSALNEPKPEHPAIIEALLEAGAAVGASGYPSGNAEVDRLLERFGAEQ
jgi:hypothetical protein